MPRFRDLKTALALSDSRRRITSFREYAEHVHEYAVSEDPATAAFERTFFSDQDFSADEALLGDVSDAVFALESSLSPVLAKMEATGVWVSKDELVDIAEELRAKSKNLELEMLDLVGEPFNPNSAKQVQYVLFEKLGIPSGKKIKTGFSVDSETLEEIGKTYAIAHLILEYRTYEKLRSTYAE
ncbi:MAG: polymerase [Patescibacteria group bacterium]|nr:polymerase [Patescibacteria group bacterium]